MYRIIFCFTCLLTFSGVEGITQTVTEGSNLAVFCDGDTPHKGHVYWEDKSLHFHQDGATLSIHNIQRNFTGQYDCFEVDTSTNKSWIVYEVFIDVTYPAKILSANVFKSRLLEEETFTTEVLVEGNPSPQVKLTQISDHDVVYEDNKDGQFNISFVVHCHNIGSYLLTCSNDLNYDTMDINITVICKPKPDPDHTVNATFKPRLGESVDLKMIAIGYPPPMFQWWHNGVHRDSEDTPLSSVLTIDSVAVPEFGTYILNMSNEGGYFIKDFEILADGPPSPVTGISLVAVSTTNASLTLTTGFDYNDTQTFVAMRYKDGKLTELNSVKDVFPDDGKKKYSFTVTGLTVLTNYNITMVSKNSKGMSPPAQEFVTFLTEGAPESDPDKTIQYKYTPRVGDNVTLEMFSIANPAPNYTWEHAGSQLQHMDNGSYSTVDFHVAGPENYGIYTLTMNNSVGTSTHHYFVEADGPPSPVANLSLASVSTTNASISFFTGFDYNDTQTFVAMRYLDGKMTELLSVKDDFPDQGQKPFSFVIKGLAVLTMYNLTVVSRNSRGSSQPALNSITFLTEGAPESDPDKKIIFYFKPRVGENITLEMFSKSNPAPTYTWQHGGKQVPHIDNSSYSTVDLIAVRPDDYGMYNVTMSNSVGTSTYNYVIVADGPPSPVTNICLTAVSTTNASLTFISGFDYNAAQTFVAMRYQDGKMTELYSVKDTFPDQGQKNISITIKGLSVLTMYNLTVVVRNSRGTSPPALNSITFLTEGPPAPDPDNNITYNYKPRVGENVTLEMFAIGNPAPIYTWQHDGTDVQHTDKAYYSSVDLRIGTDSFGTYTVLMSNSVGKNISNYLIEADGPPDAATGLAVGNISTTTASLSWMPGFDYGSAQTFIVLQLIGEQDQELDSFVPENHTLERITHNVTQLKSDTTYMVRINARNKNGEAANLSNTVQFHTEIPTTPSPTTTPSKAHVISGACFPCLLTFVAIKYILLSDSHIQYVMNVCNLNF